MTEEMMDGMIKEIGRKKAQGWSLINCFHMHRQLYTRCMRTHEMYQHNTRMYIYMNNTHKREFNFT